MKNKNSRSVLEKRCGATKQDGPQQSGKNRLGRGLLMLGMIVLLVGRVSATDLSVTNYGANGGDTADDTAAFNAAITASVLGDNIVVPSGSYYLDPITLKAGTQLVGTGVDSSNFGTSYLYANTSYTGSTSSLITMQTGCVVKKIILVGNWSATITNAVAAAYQQNCVVWDTRIYYWNGNGILFDHVGLNIVAPNATASNYGAMVFTCNITNVGQNGVSIVFSRYILVQGSYFYNIGTNGIISWGVWLDANGYWDKSQYCIGIHAVDNQIRNAVCGVFMTGTTHSTMISNYVEATSDVGLDYEGCEYSFMTGNTSRYSVNGPASLFYTCNDIVIWKNTLEIGEPAANEYGIWRGLWLTALNTANRKDDSGHNHVAVGENTFSNGTDSTNRRSIWIETGDNKDVRVWNNTIINSTNNPNHRYYFLAGTDYELPNFVAEGSTVYSKSSLWINSTRMDQYVAVVRSRELDALQATSTEGQFSVNYMCGTVLLSATSSSPAKLIWPVSTGETGYSVERKTGTTGTYAEVGTAAANAKVFWDTSVISATSYTYRVKTIYPSGYQYSDELSLTTPTFTTLLNENFNSTTTGSLPSGWTKTTATNTTLSVQAFPTSTNKSIKLYDNSTSGSCSVEKTFTASSDWTFASFSFYASANGPTFQLRSGTTVAVDLLLKNGNLIYRNASGTEVTIMAYTANTWYSVKVVPSVSLKTFDLYVGGVLKVKAGAFRNSTMTSLDRVNFGTDSTAQSTSYIDDVFIQK
jgi:hypothetical protein